MTKFALYKYGDTGNIGDEIQSIAARRFLPRVDYFIDRDRVGRWKSNTKEKVKLIANGWYMHEPYAWPISDKFLEILPISMHINRTDKVNSEVFVSEKSQRFFKNFDYIGARDKPTETELQKNGIKARFSACLTLTIQSDSKIKKQDYILAVAVSDKVYEEIKKRTNRRVIRFTPGIDLGINSTTKFEIAEYILFLYQSAHCVITTRLHTMLPCLAFGTPVLFIEGSEKYDTDRYKGLQELTRSVSEEEFLKNKDIFNINLPLKNFDKYKKYRDDLIRRCEKFTGYNNSTSFSQIVDFALVNQEGISDKIPVLDYELKANQIVEYIKSLAEKANDEKVSILILVHNAPKYINLTIKSLRKNTKGNYEVIVLDNASNFPTHFLLKILKFTKKIDKLIVSANNVLFAGGNNILSKEADLNSKYFLLLNSDVEIKNNKWLEKLLKAHKTNNAGITSYGVVESEPKRVDGYCYLINSDLYKKFPLDENYQWWWAITKQQAQILTAGHKVQGFKRFSKYMHHFGGKSGGNFTDAKGMNTTVEDVKRWFNGKRPRFL